MLKVKLGDGEIRTFQPDSDAVVLVVGTAVKMQATTDVSIVGEGVNLMDLLIAKADAHKEIVSIIPSETTFLGRAVFQTFTECDTTFFAFLKSNIAFANLKSSQVQKAAAFFSEPSSTTV